MKQEVHELIQAVRDLEIEITDQAAPNCVRITATRSVFATKLKLLQEALEAVDRVGAASTDVETPHPKDNPDKLRAALDGLMRLYQIKGGNLDEATEVIQNALGLTEETAKSQNTYDTLPNFAADRLKRARRHKYRLSLVPDRHATITFNTLRKMYFEVMHSRALLGSTVGNVPRVDKDAEASKVSAPGR